MTVIDSLKGIVTMATDAQDSLTLELKAQYDQGYADGKASVVLPDPNNPDKLFTQADMDRVAQTAKDEQTALDQSQIDALNKSVSDAQAALVVAQADVAGQVAAGVAAFKAAELPKLQDLESRIKELEADNA